MSIKRKHLVLLAISILCIFSLCGCEDKNEKRYQNYVKGLISINYLGATDEYIQATGANLDDANALYQNNLNMLANNILSYYNLTIVDSPELMTSFADLAKNIYSRVNYKVSKAYKIGKDYYIDVTVYPINLFNQTTDEVNAYIEQFNARVANGDYNDYTLSQYETEFSNGLIGILNNGCLNMTYAEPQTVRVAIVVDQNTYYISDHDFLNIDNAMICTD